MATQTFPCPFCGKKMGVGIELLGKKVRCPHCNQVLVAPAPAAVPVAPPPPQVEKRETTPPDLPKFNIPSQEARESIFGEQEEEGDDVFGSPEENKLRVPEVPPPEPVPTVQPQPPASSQPTPIPDQPTVEMKSPLPDVVPTVAPAPVPVVAPLPPPVTIPTVTPVASPRSVSASGNPWAGMDQLPSAPVPTVVPTPVEVSPFAEVEPSKGKRREEPDEDRPKRSRPAAPAGSPLFKIGFFILAPYALIVTVAAIYGLYLKSSVPAGHPLSNLPDNFGEYGPAERRKTGKLPVPVDGELPAEQKVALGGGNKLDIGQLQIEPLGVEQRTLKYVTEGKTANEKRTENSSAPAIVLKLRIRNASDDLTIHPLDPAFNRKIPGTERIGTGLAVGKTTYWGGAIVWPFDARVSRKYEAAQEAEATPLKPGESREYVVFTDANSRVVKAVRETKEPLLWRVHVRRGRINFDGKEIPVTAIIGVEFKASDVKEPD